MDQAHEGMVGVASQIHQEQLLPQILPDWFAALWHIIRATEPTLQNCVDRLESSEDGAFVQSLSAYYRHKLVDEADHGVWLLDDVEHVGMSRESLDRMLPAAPIVAMVGSQSYWIDYVHPAIYLGYIGLLEGYTVSSESVESLIRESGAPRAAFATYEFHQTEDIEHRKDLECVLDAVPEDAFLRQAIIANGIRCTANYCQAMEGMLAQARARERSQHDARTAAAWAS
jgi:hypothetical protein